MEENTNNAYFAFDLPKNQSSYIKVIGVGGGGTNAVNHMYREGIHGVDFIVCNTDMKSLNSSPVPNKIPLGELGLGAGNKPEKARKNALDKADEIREAISHNTQMLFITAGMGGGTGTGAAPVIAQIAKSVDLDSEDTKKILVVAIVTQPFYFEGKRRLSQALEGIEELRKHVDAILVINNDKLRQFKDFALSKAFGMANDVLLTAVKGIAEIITVDAYVNIDFQDVNTVMENSGTALMGTGVGFGEQRALNAIEEATTSVLLDDNDISGSKNVLLYFSYHPDHEITMDELGEITDYLGQKTSGVADVIWGAGADDTMGEELKVTLIATGFEKNDEGQTYSLDVEKKAPTDKTPTPAPSAPQTNNEPVVIKKEPMPQPVAPEPEAHTVQPAPASTSKRVFKLEPDPVAEPVKPVNVAPKVDPLQDFHIINNAEKREAAPVAEVPASKPVVAPVAEEAPVVAPVAEEAPVRQPVAETVVEEPVAVAQQPAPAPMQHVEPKPAPVQPAATFATPTPYDPASQNSDRIVRDMSDRMRRIAQVHDMLRNKPNGAEAVELKSLEQVSASAAYAYDGVHSSTPESSRYEMRPDGTMVRKPGFFDNPD